MLNKGLHTGEKGAYVVEVSLAFVVMLTMLIGTFEIGRALWTLHSVSSSIEDATRYAAARGAACSAASKGCPPSVGEIVERIRLGSRGLEAERFEVTLRSGFQEIRCASLRDCAADPRYWPAWTNKAPGSSVTIRAVYTFDTILFALLDGNAQSGFKLRTESSEVLEF